MADYPKARRESETIWKNLFLNAPPLPILEVSESYGLSVLEADFSFRPGLSGVLDVEKQIIFVNRADSPTRKRFTIAHELGHWLLHPKDVKEKDSSLALYYRHPLGGETDDKEKEANCFAANLLVPLKQLKIYYRYYSRQQLADLFAVSLEVIGYRLQDLAGAEDV